MQLTSALNLRELQRYLSRVGDRWPLQMVMLGGERVAELRNSSAETATPSSGAEYIVVLVSSGFDGMPWLERIYQASALWDALEMGDGADLHCYTPVEFLRRRESSPVMRRVAERGLLLFEDSEPFNAARA